MTDHITSKLRDRSKSPLISMSLHAPTELYYEVPQCFEQITVQMTYIMFQISNRKYPDLKFNWIQINYGKIGIKVVSKFKMIK